MGEVIIGLGSNLGDRLRMIRYAAEFLEGLSGSPIEKSSLWESDPLGPAEHPFYNSIAILHTTLPPPDLLRKMKAFEQDMGREASRIRWGPRQLDLDIIAWDSLVIHQENLIIPHPEYRNRPFVLLPLQELRSDWTDPEDGTEIGEMLKSALRVRIQKTKEAW